MLETLSATKMTHFMNFLNKKTLKYIVQACEPPTKLIKVTEFPATADSFLERDTFQFGRFLDPLPLTFRKLLFFSFHAVVLAYQHLSHD